MRVVSGIQPTGQLHLGNYFGAIGPNLARQRAAGGPDRAFFFVADLHALTTVHDGALLRRLTRDAAIDCLALGLDPKEASLFRQSDVPEVCELAWLLTCCVGKGLLERAHAYKDKVARGLPTSMGLFSYPILMAADVLVYKATLVPVGKDQQQHIEMAQDMAASFNAAFGREVLVRPEWHLEDVPVVPGRDGAKMSKTYGNTIPLFLPEGMTAKARYRAYFAGITTDSRGVEEPKDPNDTLMTLYRLVDPAGAAEVEPAYVKGGVGYGEMKQRLFEAHEARFGPARERRARLEADRAYVDGVLEEGAARARAVARELMAEARDACGIGP